MKAMFSAEAIGWGASRSRSPRNTFDVRRPYVDELTGLAEQGGYLRRRLRSQVDWRQMNSTGNRGAYLCWTLTAGCVYEAHYRETWDRWTVRLLAVDLDGRVVDIGDDEVQARLGAAPAAEVNPTADPPACRQVEQPVGSSKRFLGVDVLTAARERIDRVFSDFPRVYVSFSGGKDSGVLLELAAQEARRRGRRLGCLFIDLEAQYALTIDYIQEMLDRHADVLDVYWVSLPLNLRNAVSQFEPQWMCWDPNRRADWVREPPTRAIADEGFFPFFRQRMEFEEFTPEFGEWYAAQTPDGQPQMTACLVGIRTAESLNRWRTIASRRKRTHEGYQWTTWLGGQLYNAYPIYDWATEDIWRYYGKTGTPYNRLYDRMHQAGLTIHQARICQPYGDDQRKGLWLYHTIEPETWSRVVARVNGANFGAAHARDSGNVLGRIKITKPDDLTWQEFAMRLLESMPPPTRLQYENKIAVFLRWWSLRGYPEGEIPDGDLSDVGDKTVPTWARICKMLLKNDYWAKTLSFTPTKPEAYLRYRALMAKRRAEWGLI